MKNPFFLKYLPLLLAAFFASPAYATPCDDAQEYEKVLSLCVKEAQKGRQESIKKLADACATAKDTESAEKWQALYERRPEAITAMSMYWIHKKDFDMALRWLDLLPDYPGITETRAEIWLLSERSLSPLLEKELHDCVLAGSYRAMFIEGRFALRRGDEKRALAHFRKAAEGYAPSSVWIDVLEGKDVETEGLEPELLYLFSLKGLPGDEKREEAGKSAALGGYAQARVHAFENSFPGFLPEERREALRALALQMHDGAAMELAADIRDKDEDAAWRAVEIAALAGNPRAIYMCAMRGEDFPPSPEASRKRAEELNRLVFSPQCPEDIKKSAARWLAFFLASGAPPLDAADPALADRLGTIADLKDGDAFYLAVLHDGSGNRESALTWYEEAAKSGEKAYLHEVAKKAWEFGLPEEEAFALSARAAESGYPPSMLMFSRILEKNGKMADAAAFLFTAADALCPEALYSRALAGLSGKVVRSHEQITEDLVLALSGGFAEAGYVLADLYGRGKCVPRDPALSAKYAHRAALDGVPRAMTLIGRYALEGFGMKRDRSFAAKWLSKAAGKGDRDAADICRRENFEFELPLS